jgi:NAD(P)-dependent dehydrogenase (short-subunit alcohol dehydrogenase family)
MEDAALVVGSAAGNIGMAIEQELAQQLPTDGIEVINSNHGLRWQDLQAYRYLVITCGVSDITPLDKQSLRGIARVVDACLTTPLDILRTWIESREAFTGHSGRLQSSHAVVLGSYAHDHVLSNSTAYCAAKAGLNMAIKSLAWDYAAKGFRFNCINPHSVEDTPMTGRVIEQIAVQKEISTDEAMAYWKRTLQLPERLTRAEVAKTVAWLMLDCPTAHLSGSSIELYGGER